MSRVSGVIPNLINGISQQPPQLRLSTQGNSQINAHSTPLEGLTNRPTTRHLALLANSLASDAHVHFINRDAVERYVVTCDGTTLKVYDLEGTSKTVTISNYADASASSAYFNVSDPKTELRFLTVADYTFVLNRTKTVAMTADVKTARPYECLINVKAGNFGRTYKVRIDGTTKATYVVPNGDVATDVVQTDTVVIATELYDDLVTAGYSSAPWTITRYQNCLHLRNTTTDFAVAVEDGYNGLAMSVAKDTVQRFTDLPSFGPHGFAIKVTGDSANTFDDFWLEFEKPASSNNNSSGVWVECASPGTLTTFSNKTMPHQLVRNVDGTFTFGPVSWDTRTVGDATVAPPPSFIGLELKDLFFHKNRLGFLCDENVVMSKSGDFFDFWRGTMVTVLDDDYIDVSTTHTKVSTMEHAVPFDGRLLLFSEFTQFELSADGFLSPNTVALTPKSSFESDIGCKPITDGRSVYFTNERGAYGSVYEFDKDAIDVSYRALDTTSHVPKYIPNSIWKIASSSGVDTLIAVTDGDLDALYVYKSYFVGDEKVQSSWSRWDLPGVSRIFDAEIIDAAVYLVVQRDTKVYLENLSLAPNAADEGATYLTRLDRKVTSADMAAGTYSAITDLTTYTLPYAVPTADEAIFVACTREVVGDASAAGVQITIDDITTTTIKLEGDTTALPLWFGYRVAMEYEFSTQLVRQDSPNGGLNVISEGRLQLHYLNLEFGNTAYFQVEVTAEDRAMKTYTFSRPTMSSTNPLTTESSRYKVPIMTRADTVSIKIVSDSYLPLAILSAEWTGQYMVRHQRLS
jgi:hypothetical protein